MSNCCDVAIIGSGLIGSALASILAKRGLSVTIFEAGTHPRFAIGESMILESSELLRSLGSLYDVPELTELSSEFFLHRAGSSHGVKRHFGFVHHGEGGTHELQAVIPRYPHGHELHLFRQDSDAKLLAVAVSAGVHVFQNTRVTGVILPESPGGMARLETRAGVFEARFVVDASGLRNVLREHSGSATNALHTHSRAAFTHAIGVKAYSSSHRLPYAMFEGTLHHLFAGGWMWMIPFNNHARSTNPLCSLGVMLDSRRDPEVGLDHLVKRFPAIAGQLEHAVAVRPWTHTGRIQHRAARLSGPGWAVLGLAAGFVDPLFSKGMVLGLSGVATLADALLEAWHKTPEGGLAPRLGGYEDMLNTMLHHHDRLVAASYASFDHPEAWRVMSVIWLAGAYLELVRLMTLRASASSVSSWTQGIAQSRLTGGRFEPFELLERQACLELIEGAEPTAWTERWHTALSRAPWLPPAFRAVLEGAPSLPRNKLRPEIWLRPGGALGEGAFRDHFFAQQGLLSLTRSWLHEALVYGVAPRVSALRALRGL